jgi:lipopolysaccharide export system ATP-binding protein
MASEAGVPDFFALFRRRKGRSVRPMAKPAGTPMELDAMGGDISYEFTDALVVPPKDPKSKDTKVRRPATRQQPQQQPQPQPQPHHPQPGQPRPRRPEPPPPAVREPPAPVREPPPPARRAPELVPNAYPRADINADGYLAAHNVEKTFGGRKVVKGVSLYVRRGEAVGLLGPNGAGKTTVFYMITGLIKADNGKIELDGHEVTALPMYQRARLGIGYLPQEASIFRGLSVEDNIRAVLEVVERDPRRREADLNGLLEEFNISRLRKTPSIALSGGERRRVEIARAMATRPAYMLLDEPFAGIDPIAVGDIQVLVRHLTQRGIGVLITDHNVRETLGLTDRAYIIYSGEVLMEGRADDIVNDPEVRRLYLGEEFRM